MKFKIPFKTKNKYIQDFGLRIVSVLLAILMWLFVSMTTSSEITTRISDIPIALDVENSYLSSLGLSMSDISNETITAEIEGVRNKIGNLTAKDFSATAVIGDIKAEGSYDIEINLAKSNSTIDCKIKNFYPKKITIKLDKVNEKTFDVTAETKNIVVADGYISDTPESSVKTVTIKGTESVIEKIDRCVAIAETSKELKATASVTAPIILYDSNNNQINTSGLTLSATESTVSIPVYMKKTVPVVATFRNVPTGFNTDRLPRAQSVKEVEIAGTEEVIEKINEISLAYIDFRTMGIGSEYTLPLDFPAGVKSVNGVDYATLTFNETGFKSVAYNVSSITVKGTSKNYDVSLLTESIMNVKVIGTSETISSMTVNDIVAEIDLSSVTISGGTQYVPVNMYVPSSEGVAWISGEYSVAIEAKPIS